MKKAYTVCAMLFAAVSLKTAIENQYFYATNNIGTSTRGVLSTVRATFVSSRCCMCLFVLLVVVIDFSRYSNSGDGRLAMPNGRKPGLRSPPMSIEQGAHVAGYE